MTTQILPISFVIASLGNSSLMKTIDSIMLAEYVPKEIIIILPPKVLLNIKKKYNYPIKVINAPIKGQVAQRSYGFQYCSENLIVQSDDDMFYGKDTLINLFKNFNILGKGNILGPIYLDIKKSQNITMIREGIFGFITSLYHKYICLAPWSYKRMGSLTKIGIGYGIDPTKLTSKNPYSVKWLNGGCVLCHRNDLILDNYFPFEGKAYFEDTIHSILWNKNGKKLWVTPEAIFFQTQDNYLFDDFKSYQKRFIIHKHVVNMLGGSIFRLYIWRIFFLTKFCYLKFFKK